MSERSPIPAPGDGASGKPASGSTMRDLGPRVLSAIVMVALAFGTLWAGGQIYILAWLFVSFGALWEWQRLVGGAAQMARLFIGAAALAITAAFSAGGSGDLALAVLVLAAAAILFIARKGSAPGMGASVNEPLAWPEAILAATGVLYAGAFLVSVLVLRLSLMQGVAAILWLFAIVWGTDIVAYFAGRSIGGPKLWRRVSPSKTWSGFIGGVTGGAVAGTLLVYWLLPDARAFWPWMFVFALLLAILSQGGDLFESALKRRYGVKDSSNLIPGHGGILDRLDGFTAAAICAALVGAVRGGQINAAHGLFSW
jgi:phosphatidate cytidylyltransferase